MKIFTTLVLTLFCLSTFAQSPLETLLRDAGYEGAYYLTKLLPDAKNSDKSNVRVLTSHLDSIIAYEYADESYFETSQSKFYADQFALDTLSEDYTYDVDGLPELVRDSVWTYDALDRPVEIIIREPSVLTMTMEPEDRIRFVYNGTVDAPDTVYVDGYVSSDGSWTNQSRETYAYQSDTLLVTLLIENNTIDGYEPDQRILITYTTTGKQDSLSIEDFIPDNGGFTQIQYSNTTYNDDDLLESQVIVTDQMGLFDTAAVIEFRYPMDFDSPEYSRIVLYGGGSPFAYIDFYNTYENELLIADTAYVSFSGTVGSFNPAQLQRYNYDMMDRLVRQDILEYDGTDAIPFERTVWFYSEIDVVATSEIFQNAFHCRFANPMVSGQSINCDLPDSTPLDLRVYDTMGREVVRRNFQNGEALELDAGTYLTTLFSKEGTLRWRRQIIIR